ncbi:unnamed protein product, partial [Cyprideis torosa]
FMFQSVLADLLNRIPLRVQRRKGHTRETSKTERGVESKVLFPVTQRGRQIPLTNATKIRDPQPSMMAQIQTLKKQVVQLRQEANVPRISVSQACEDLMRFCNENQKTDVLVTGISPSENPFKENKSCQVL